MKFCDATRTAVRVVGFFTITQQLSLTLSEGPIEKPALKAVIFEHTSLGSVITIAS